MKFNIRKWNLDFDVDVIIGMNGAEIWDEHSQTLDTQHLLSTDTIQEIMELMEDTPTYPRIYLPGVILGAKNDPMIDISARKIDRAVKCCDDISDFWQQENAKIMFFFNTRRFSDGREVLFGTPKR